MPSCSLCGAPNARHHHIADLRAVIARAAAEPPGNDPQPDAEGRVDRSISISPEAITWICDRCAPAYAATHPGFRPRSAAQ